ETREDTDGEQLRLVRRWLAVPSDGRRSAVTGPTPVRRLLPLGLSLGGVALTFLGGWWSGLALALSVVGALPIVRRAVTALVGERRLTVEHLDTAAISLLVAVGDIRGAALIGALVA